MTHDLIKDLDELLNDPEADVSDVKWLVDAHRSRTRGFPGLPPELHEVGRKPSPRSREATVTATAADPAEWLTPKAACAQAKCCRQTLWRWRRRGLRTGRGGRIKRGDLEAWLSGEGGVVESRDADGGELLTLREAANRAGATRQTVWRWRNAGLKAIRRRGLVRVRADVLDEYLSRRSDAPGRSGRS
jgi:hypothetical protein